MKGVRIKNEKIVRIGTWNTKQGVAPRQKAPVLWDWIARVTNADVLVLTEAKVPKEGLPTGWTAIYTPGGLEKRKPWGTIVAARGFELRRTEFHRRRTRSESGRPNPNTTFAVDILSEGVAVLRVIGAYALLGGTGSGATEMSLILNECEDVIRDHGADRLVVAGDFNLWPSYVSRDFKQIGLVDVTGSRNSFPVLDSPVGQSRIWTHKNGPRQSNGARQEIDFVFVSKDLAKSMFDIMGGVDDYPDAWDMSDHAPVVVSVVS